MSFRAGHKKFQDWVQKKLEKSMEKDRYRHEPLPQPNYFRLINIKGASAVPFTLPLLTFPIDSCPPYDALSYTWGPPVDTPECQQAYQGRKRPILVQDGQKKGSLMVDRNLYEALFALRRSQSVDLLWADGICIDQENEAEKITQIPLMGKIYSGCQTAIAWLGVESTHAKPFFDLHMTVLTAASEVLDRHQLDVPTTDMVALQNFNEMESRFGIQVPMEAWESYCVFIEQHRWFRRAWVVQEVALAPQIIIIFDKFHLDWNMIAAVAGLLKTSLGFKLQSLRPANALTTPVGFDINLLQKMRLRCQGDSLSENREPRGSLNPSLQEMTGASTARQLSYAYLEECLHSIRSVGATDPKDKVYAVLGLFQKFTPSALDPLLVPGSIPVEEVYVRAAWLLLRELPTLSTLSYVQDPSLTRLPSLPTWVPDFSVQKTLNPFPYNLGKYGMNASLASVEMPAYRQRDGMLLHLDGAFVDDIKCHALPHPEGTDQTQLIPQLIPFLKSMFEVALGALPETPPSITDALWRTLIANATRNTMGAEISGMHFSEWILGIMAPFVALFGVSDDLKTVLDLLQVLQSHGGIRLPSQRDIDELVEESRRPNGSARLQEHDRNFSIYYNTFSGCALWRKLFLTKTGRLGLGPVSMQVGDEVWMLSGGRMLYVLRRDPRRDNTYSFVGEAYLHGFMCGELFQTDVVDNIHRISLS